MNKTLMLTLIVISQFFGTSLWFSSNAVLNEIALAHHLNNTNLLTSLTIATQLGFILGSLCYAIFNLADRFKANIVFSISILLGALFNASILFPNLNFNQIFIARFLTGLFLAGVYPVGMKIAAYFFPKTISNALGILVGALVLGTAFPHFIASFKINIDWTLVILTSSVLATIGAIMMLFLNTPAKKEIQKIDFSIIPKLFQKKEFRKASFGYFGHMWELYTFWAFTPLIIEYYNTKNHQNYNIALWSFIVISIGSLGCVIAGKLAKTKTNVKVAKWALTISAICCLLSPVTIHLPEYFFFPFLMIWGTTVVADSPLLSALINQTSIKNYNGTALTIATSIGFLVTILSIYALKQLLNYTSIAIALPLLAVGPIIGLYQLKLKN
ncbi:MFS family permease [Wenyingzhuangia heitensis]|uniref:MFS family permease n=1 Tax=Wenyingzhuangia heitensis TaxID=1487859 RepID=A0ABX0U903_9FLAO|nr:MFS transporter [Wenyingzhuangia heitensis]NIJ44688.1 MFS family permease [Wenyingzhuangia heitensis]